MTKFISGQSGNPGGRPKESVELRELARSHTNAAIETLVEIMQDSNASPSARINAAVAILDRAHGRPAAGLEVLPKHGHCTRCEWVDETLASIGNQKGLPMEIEKQLRETSVT